MLELPESFTISQQIEKGLMGKKIASIEVGHSPHRFAFFKGDQEKYDERLEGQIIEGACSHGGLVEIDTKDTMIFLGDGAYPRYYEKGKRPKKHQFLIEFEDETAIAVSIQMYGEIGVYPIDTCDDEYYLSSVSKPSPLSKKFTYSYFRGLYEDGRKLSAKAFLATEQRIPGLGNGVLQDILWNAGIDPRFDMRKAEEKDFQNMYEAIRSILEAMCKAGGRNTERDFYSSPCGYITQLSKNSLHEPCMKCGYEIQKAAYMGGTVYFCEHCQKR
ncbi:formamidopyrimidine-DNA glycosylase [Lachnospiraceae bacterium KM106-2]|nr:formamidopyrimidine-DNA glycosylase [Lachnospiraceae bacterium KM106-2]